jgi:hypothetical protein
MRGLKTMQESQNNSVVFNDSASWAIGRLDLSGAEESHIYILWESSSMKIGRKLF